MKVWDSVRWYFLKRCLRDRRLFAMLSFIHCDQSFENRLHVSLDAVVAAPLAPPVPDGSFGSSSDGGTRSPTPSLLPTDDWMMGEGNDGMYDNATVPLTPDPVHPDSESLNDGVGQPLEAFCVTLPS